MLSRWEKRFAIECLDTICSIFFNNVDSYKQIKEILLVWKSRDIFPDKTLKEAIKLFRESENKVRNLFEK